MAHHDPSFTTVLSLIAKGEVDIVTDTVPRLTGHNAMSLPEYLGAPPDSCPSPRFLTMT